MYKAVRGQQEVRMENPNYEFIECIDVCIKYIPFFYQLSEYLVNALKYVVLFISKLDLFHFNLENRFYLLDIEKIGQVYCLIKSD